jgi:hypothetical protein
MDIAIHMSVVVQAWQFAIHHNHLALPILNAAVVFADKLGFEKKR